MDDAKTPRDAAPDPLPAASVLVLRDGPLEVLLLQRHERRSFAPSAWVFPGGIAEASDRELAAAMGDDSTLAAMRVTAARETFEESGLWLGEPLSDSEGWRRKLLGRTVPFRDLVTSAVIHWGDLVLTSRWITPVGLPKRFDTWFFLAAVSREAVATAEESESVEALWLAPAEALRRHAEGSMGMVFPTLRNLEALAGYSNTEELFAARRDAVVEPVLPVLVEGKPTLR